MNILKYNQQGGVPVNADDIQWQIEELLKGYGYAARALLHQESFKLWGIRHLTQFGVTKGAIYHNNRVYYHPEINPLTIPSGYVKVIEIVTEDDSNSNSMFADSISRPMKQNQYARTIAVHPDNTSGYIPFDIRTHEAINWTTLPVKNPGNGDVDAGTGLHYRISTDGYVHVRGNLNPEDSSYRYFLPVTARPSSLDHNKIFPIICYTEDLQTMVKITGIQSGGNSDGIFSVTPNIPNDNIPIYVPEFSFRADWGRL